MIIVRTNRPAGQPRYCRFTCTLLVTFASAMPWAAARAESYDQGPVFALLEENDLFVNTDRHYTQGLKLSYLQCDDDLPGWARSLSDALPAWGYDQRVVKFGYELGQNIYTPSDITIHTAQPHDRPYAGWLYTGFIWQRRGRTDDRIPTLESIQLDLGVIGPGSLAREAQTTVHRIRGFQLPEGWSHQLDNEPGLALKYQRTLRFSAGPEESRWLDLLPHAGFSLGNVETAARAGGELRLGWHLPDNYGFQNIDSLVTAEGGRSRSQPDESFRCFLFGAAEGKLVGYTAFLDGNLTGASPQVDKEPWVAELRTGFGVAAWRLEGGVALTYRTREFIRQTENNRYGSVYLTVRF